MNGVYIKKFNYFLPATFYFFCLLVLLHVLHNFLFLWNSMMDMDILESIADLDFLSFHTICHSLFNLHFLEQENVLLRWIIQKNYNYGIMNSGNNHLF